jgi:hypothetical protein
VRNESKWLVWSRTLSRICRYLRLELDARCPQNLVWPELRVDRLVGGRTEVSGEHDVAAAADAVAERAQAVGGRRAVALEAATLALGCRLAALVQRAFSVPSGSSSAFEIFWAAGSSEEAVPPGTVAYGNVVPPPSGRT